MMKISPACLLIDGSSYLFRAYHALPSLMNAEGQPTGAIYGVVAMLKKLLKTYDPDYVVVVFDPKGKTVRHKKDASYKANRKETPPDLVKQIPILYEIIEALGLSLVIEEGIEADDVIGSLAYQFNQHYPKHLLGISTVDKDMAQLVNDYTYLINTMKDSCLDPQGVKEKFGVWPNQMIDYLSLVGDASDNIKGLPGVGPKTAVKWLTRYLSLDGIYDHADEIKGKVGEALRRQKSLVLHAKSMVTIDCAIQLNRGFDVFRPASPNDQKLKQHFQSLGFKTWLTELIDVSEKSDLSTCAYELILDHKALFAWIHRLKQKGQLAFDLETTHLDPFEAKIVGMSFACDVDAAAYVPCGHAQEANEGKQTLSLDMALQAIKPLLEDPKYLVIGQNIKYDKAILLNYGIKVNHYYDTMLASYILNSTATRHDMDRLAWHYLHRHTQSYEKVTELLPKGADFSYVPLSKALPYAAEDAEVTWLLYQLLRERLEKIPALQTLLNTLELPLVEVLRQMEANGVLIDITYLQKQSADLGEALADLKEKIYHFAGMTFNVNSAKQVREVLFGHLDLPVLEKTPKGQASTSEAALQALSAKHEIVEVLLTYRNLSKLKSTYTDKLPHMVQAKTGRIHCAYNQAITSTGRLSSTHPNLQNIPIRTIEGRRIREAFIAPQGYELLAADYSQIELRIMAHLSQDLGLIEAFRNNQDIHQVTASEIFSVDLERVTKDQRRSAKAINFGLMYGMSAFGLAKQLGISRKEAQFYIDFYFDRYPGVLAYIKRMQEKVRQLGYVETLYGRRLYLPDINSDKVHLRKAAERAAVNAPMQGSSADMIKQAMIQVHHWLQAHSDYGRLIMQVHDELVLEVNQNYSEEVMQAVKSMMEDVITLSLPLQVSIGRGKNWDKAHA